MSGRQNLDVLVKGLPLIVCQTLAQKPHQGAQPGLAARWLVKQGFHFRGKVEARLVLDVEERFDAESIASAEEGPWLNAKSIAKVMGAKIPVNSTLYFEADGEEILRVPCVGSLT